MDWNSFLKKGLLQSGICLVLAAAMVLSLALPGLDLEKTQPQNPLEDESIREINVLNVGENITQLNTIVVPSGGSAAPTEPKDENPEETNPEETKPEETVPEETESEEQDIGDGEEGNEDGNQGEEGGRELDLELAAVMTWYKYGNDPKTIVCSPGNTVAKTLNTAQLRDNELNYEFSLEGEDAKYVEITSVTMAAGDTAQQRVGERDRVEIQLPGGTGKRNYTFQVNALVEKENDEGGTVQQEISFVFVLHCEYTLDLELNLTWADKDGLERIVVCGPDKAAAFSVRNYDLKDREFSYSVKLTGTLAEDAEIISATYTTASGQQSGNLDGSLTLKPEPGKDKDTYYLTFTVKTGQRTVLYTYNLVYQETLDVTLSLRWEEQGMIGHTLDCKPGGTASDWVKNNQLTAGAIPYSFTFQGGDSENLIFESISYTSDAGGGKLEETGILPIQMPDGGTTNTYYIHAAALVKGQRMNFEYVLHYSNDIMLQMEYEVSENGQPSQRMVTCENGKTRTAENIYDDELSDGMLAYKMRISGSDAENISIQTVSCYQSGSGRERGLDAEGELKLLLNEGKTGENTFRVLAVDDGGNQYNFTINIPYKHRGGNNIRIETNLDNTTLIPNGIKTNLTVKAWSHDDHGNVISYIPANGTETKLIVRLDDVEIPYTSSSGTSSEYDLVPENPLEGDTNEHTLYIYAEDAYGNHAYKTITLTGERRDPGQKIGTATIVVDMTVLGLGIVQTIPYDVLANEPISYVIAKALLGEDLGEPFGKAKTTLAWGGTYEGTLDEGFYLQSLTTGHTANALEDSTWPGSTEAEVLDAINEQFGKETGLAALWRCLYRNGLNKSSGSGGTFGEFDYTSGSGWMYSVGSSTYYPGQSMSAVYLQDGDVLTVRYTLAQGWDVGGGSPGYGATIGYCVSASDGKFDVDHRMQTETGADGSTIEVCYFCGLVQTCAHEHQKYKDQANGTHILHCEDCNTDIGDWEEHEWPTEDDGVSTAHICEKCGVQEEHRWRELEGTNTADCVNAGTVDKVCRDCEVERTFPSPATGHVYHNTTFSDATGHYIECSECLHQEAERHQYEYYADVGDFICRICYAMHNMEVCGDTLPYAEPCETVDHICEDCGYQLYRPAEEDHSYDEYGQCEYCGAQDPNYSEPETDVEEEAASLRFAWFPGKSLLTVISRVRST